MSLLLLIIMKRLLLKFINLMIIIIISYYAAKGAYQLPDKCAADQCLCFRFIDSAIPLLPKSDILR